jgi:protein-tyrosine phosphatase
VSPRTLPTSFELKPARYNDPDVAALLQAYLLELAGRDPQLRNSLKMTAIDSSIGANAVPDDFNPPEGLFVGAFIGGELIGIGGVRCFFDGHIRVGEIKRMFLAPAGRGRGISRVLLSHLEDAAIAFGCDVARLDTRSSLTEARALYTSHGYLEIERYNDNPFAQHFFEKPLRADYLAFHRFATSQGFATADLPSANYGVDRRQPLVGAHNFRDAGGYGAADGRKVHRSLLFRSDQMSGLMDRDHEILGPLGILRVFDFRLDSERERQPSRFGGGFRPPVTELSTSDTQGIDSSVIDVIRDSLSGVRPLPDPTFWEDAYEDIFSAARPMFVAMFAALTADGALPALYHCTGGKDRTGMATMLLHRLLGVSDADIIDDFLATNLFRSAVRIAALREGFRDVGVDPLAAIPLVGVTRSAIERALEVLDQTYGGAEAYLLGGGLSPNEVARLRESLLTQASESASHSR